MNKEKKIGLVRCWKQEKIN